MASEIKRTVASDDALTGDTSAPGMKNGGLIPEGTTDTPSGDTTASYTPTIAAFLDKSFEKNRFIGSRFLLLLVSLGWFGLIAFMLVSDQINDNLTTIAHLKFFGFKVGMITLLAVILGFLVWIFGKKD